MDNVLVITFLFWPAVVLLCAGINMLVSWTFSWSELIFDLLIGMIAGYFLYAGAQPEASGATAGFFVFSHGLFALLYLASAAFRDAIGDPVTCFFVFAGIRLGATLWAAAWDYASDALGAEPGWKQALFSLVLMPVKLPFALATSAVGLLIWLAGAAWAIFGKGKVGLAGGMLFSEFKPGGGDYQAVTLGSTMHTWFGDTPFKHELYHTRQYIYQGDWLIPFWCLGCVWGMISAAIAGKNATDFAFRADSNDEVGNPIEVAAYHLKP